MGTVFRAFPELLKALDLAPQHLVHVGAHEGQEVVHYRRAGIGRLTLVEPQQHLARELRHRFPQARVEAVACGREPGEAVLHLMARSNMATLAAPRGVDRLVGTQITPVVPLRDLAPDADAAVVDAQGLELEVLRGADLETGPLQLVIVETCTVAGDHTMASPHGPVVAHMRARGWVPRDQWVRDYQAVHRWARGVEAPTRGQVRDVIFTRS